MEGLLSLVIPALIPVLADGVRNIIAMITGSKGAQPQTVDEAIKWMQAETARLQALAALDQPSGPVSPWVANLRASTRYIIAIGVLIAAILSAFVPTANPAAPDILISMAGSVWSFLFGERMYLALRGTKK